MASIAIIGLGVVGGAFFTCLKRKNIPVYAYDKFKESDPFEVVLDSDIAFLSLPTPFDNNLGEYNKSAIHDVCQRLDASNYTGSVVLQSTVEPETTDKLDIMYPSLDFIHSPEFISARTALQDMIDQKHIVLGRSSSCSDEKFKRVHKFYKTYFPDAAISVCKAIESEIMKIGINSFYAVKLQYFNELYLICKETSCDYDWVKEMMFGNGWINPMHTMVPGTDGKLSYGGMCFPKDTKALLKYMERKGCPHKVLEGAVKEQAEMR